MAIANDVPMIPADAIAHICCDLCEAIGAALPRGLGFALVVGELGGDGAPKQVACAGNLRRDHAAALLARVVAALAGPPGG